MPIDVKVLVCCTGEGFLYTGVLSDVVVGGLLCKLKLWSARNQEWGLN